jgi:hypothetical protein
LLERHAKDGAVLVRGYRMITIPLSNTEWVGQECGDLWKAVFHLVVAHPPKNPEVSSKWIYECASASEKAALGHEDDAPFLFLPSSRAHAELTDEQVLSGDWLLGVVIGGNRIFCDLVVADNGTRGRERTMVQLSPEDCIAKPRLVFYHFPHFFQWFQNKKRAMSPDSMRELMGFPCVTAADQSMQPNADLFEGELMLAALERNTSGLIDGGRLSFHLQNECLRALYNAELTVDQVRAKWFAHYDNMLADVDVMLERKYKAMLKSKGFKT